MYLENLRNNEVERIAYLTGDYMAVRAFAALDDAERELSTAEGRLSDLEDAAEADTDNVTAVMESTLSTIACCYQLPGKVNKDALLKMARTVIDIIATPYGYTPDSARQAVYKAFGHEVAA